jgi:hypothetical protein
MNMGSAVAAGGPAYQDKKRKHEPDDKVDLSYLDSPIVDCEANILGRDTMIPFNLISIFSALGDSVVRISTRRGCGTGFIVGHPFIKNRRQKHYVISNEHVLIDHDNCREATIMFKYDSHGQGVTLPVEFEFVSRSLDYGFVSVDAENIKISRSIYLCSPCNPPSRATVTIVQHPGGGPKMIDLRGNKINSVEGNIILYDTMTERVSSGSPCFLDDGTLVALHAGACPALNDRKEPLLLSAKTAIDRNDPRHVSRFRTSTTLCQLMFTDCCI